MFTTHSLVELGKQGNISKILLLHLRELAPEYTVSRYPDVTETLPYENYSEEKARSLLKKTQEVFA
jgi:HEPN domain-containing protein